ncbi:hypothetical protein [Streptomyces sp. SID161]|uniref:hypothetical protein n=1 Tax=Streptomyces sp. SID161 TaxID=2690251 RepID=UPI0013691396|nr:hypothetical protein [Streptomyces sp. SID161]MYW46394.1 hypothetical protein [Streptomyces sp. SID161]
MNHHNDGFDQAIAGYHDSPYQQPNHIDSNPYGIPANSIPHKPGLTKRGKVAISVGTAVLATGGLVFWQHSTAMEEASQAKQQQIQLENKKLDLEMMREINRASEKTSKGQSGSDTDRQKQIEACVNTDKSLVGKQLGVTYSSVLKDCQDRFPAASTSTGDMQTAASSTDANADGSPVNGGLLIGGAALVGGILLVARRRPNSHSQ